MTEDVESKGRGSWPVWAAVALALYIASIGPVDALLDRRGYPSGMLDRRGYPPGMQHVIIVIYAPIIVLCGTPIIGEPIEDVLSTYSNWCGGLMFGP